MSLGVNDVKAFLQRPHFGVLIIRLGMGALLMFYGWQKFSGGEEALHRTGECLNVLGLEVGKESAVTLFAGIAAAGAELIGGFCLIVGWMFRPALLFLLITFSVAASFQYLSTDGDLSKYGYPLVIVLILLGLVFTGPFRYSVQGE